jgi:2-polyprenyl-6-methoxyphenol hydroxylase-like FAD-dependent oxidoreductase
LKKTSPESDSSSRFDVVICGGGLAGLTLARHLLLETDKRVLLLERRSELPGRRQKVGESTVQVGGYYLSRVLRLEEHLLRDHYMKYNLRFYWPTEGADPARFQDYGQVFIRQFSNVASYQIDRNRLEEHLFELCSADPRFEVCLGARVEEVSLDPEGEHRLRYVADDGERSVAAHWVVDASGRGRWLARRLESARPSRIRHGAFFWWVDGLVDIERLTDLSSAEVRRHPSRHQVGHSPIWLATNHFMAEGLWFWVIPLQGKTSLGLVFDHEVIDPDDVLSAEKACEWVCRAFPLFARDLPSRKVLGASGYRDFAHDCARTISAERWAMTGEAGRFSDPLYSPGSDLIALHNTLIVAAVRSEPAELAAKCELYEHLMRAGYEAYVPSYADSYNALGDQEVFALKYGWELAIYFSFYVFPFVNDLLTDQRFLLAFLRLFSRLGPLNARLQEFLAGYFEWKRERGGGAREPIFFDLMTSGPLRSAERTFYEVGVTTEDAKGVLREQLQSLEDLYRFSVVWVASRVLDEPGALTDRGFIEALDPLEVRFDVAWLRGLYERSAGGAGSYSWSFDSGFLEPFLRAEVEALGTRR